MTEKESAIYSVLKKRRDILQKSLQKVQSKEMKEYFTGKVHGYEQAMDLLGSSLDSIAVEL